MYGIIHQNEKGKLFTYYCRLLINFANSYGADQARQNVGPDLDPNYLTLRVYIYSWKNFEKLILKKSAELEKTKSMKI